MILKRLLLALLVLSSLVTTVASPTGVTTVPHCT